MSGESLVVTGGTGSFGRAFIRHALATPARWRRVVAFSRDEIKHAQLYEEFGHYPAFRRPFGGDVRDRDRLVQAFRGVDVVVHAAALKRIDAGAYNPREMVLTNVVGTMNVVEAAVIAGVKKVVVISSDKACAATNLYGATKYAAETCAIQENSQTHPCGTRVAAVRYGNIIGSRGSVVHIWRDQMAQQKPLTITDLRMTRFIMTIEQAVELVLFTIDNMAGGEVFIPKLASASMLSLAQAVAGDDCVIDVTGLRPGGEKLAERLLNEEEPTRTVDFGYYYAVLPSHHEWTTGAEWRGLPRIEPGFDYSSDRETLMLSPDDLRVIMRSTETLR